MRRKYGENIKRTSLFRYKGQKDLRGELKTRLNDIGHQMHIQLSWPRRLNDNHQVCVCIQFFSRKLDDINHLLTAYSFLLIKKKLQEAFKIDRAYHIYEGYLNKIV